MRGAAPCPCMPPARSTTSRTARRMELEHQDRCKSGAQPPPARAAYAHPIQASCATRKRALVVVRGVHRRALLEQRLHALRVAMPRCVVQRRVPAWRRHSHPRAESAARPLPARAAHANPIQATRNAHLSLFSAFTAAPFSSSALTLSVWPFLDARCSAVHLHGADTLHHKPNRPHGLCRRRQPSPIQYRHTSKRALRVVLGVHGRALLEQRLHALRVAMPRCVVQRRPSAWRRYAHHEPNRAQLCRPLQATNIFPRKPSSASAERFAALHRGAAMPHSSLTQQSRTAVSHSSLAQQSRTAVSHSSLAQQSAPLTPTLV